MNKRFITLWLLLLCALPVVLAQSRAALLEKAQAGDAEAQYKLGICYKFGKQNFRGKQGKEPYDYDAAEKWYLRAAEQEYSPAYSALGSLYEYDKENKAEAIKWYKKAADDSYKKYGDANNWYVEELEDLGINYDPCTGKASHVAYALTDDSRTVLLEKAEAGNAVAQEYLASCYHFGKLSYAGKTNETSRDYDAAEKWYLRAAEQGETSACFGLGMLYQYEKNDRAKAIEWYKKSADIYYGKYGKKDPAAIKALEELGVYYDPSAGNRSYASTGSAGSSGYRSAPDYTAGSGSGSSPRFDLEGDTKIVNDYIRQSDSHAATTYLNNLFKGNQYPEDADVLFGYACLVQDLIVQIQKEGAQAVGSMDIMSSMTTTIDQQSANNMQVALLFLAASKGHQGASRMLQLKAAMQSGGGVHVQPSPPSDSRSVVGEKTCSFCHGKGWIAGSKTPTYGNTGTYWCEECHCEVNASHSHDRCPSCNGTGTIPTINY